MLYSASGWSASKLGLKRSRLGDKGKMVVQSKPEAKKDSGGSDRIRIGCECYERQE